MIGSMHDSANTHVCSRNVLELFYLILSTFLAHFENKNHIIFELMTQEHHRRPSLGQPMCTRLDKYRVENLEHQFYLQN